MSTYLLIFREFQLLHRKNYSEKIIRMRALSPHLYYGHHKIISQLRKPRRHGHSTTTPSFPLLIKQYCSLSRMLEAYSKDSMKSPLVPVTYFRRCFLCAVPRWNPGRREETTVEHDFSLQFHSRRFSVGRTVKKIPISADFGDLTTTKSPI